MRSSDADILIVPGISGSGPDHWQSRWEARLSTARRIGQADWDRPLCADWVAAIVAAVDAAERPALLVAHSLGVVAVAHAAPRLKPGAVRGAFLVGLPDIEDAAVLPDLDAGFLPIPRAPLPFPTVLVASRTDPHAAYARAEDFSRAWGAELVDAGDSGHLNGESGHGPWPEGLRRFAGFLKGL